MRYGQLPGGSSSSLRLCSLYNNVLIKVTLSRQRHCRGRVGRGRGGMGKGLIQASTRSICLFACSDTSGSV